MTASPTTDAELKAAWIAAVNHRGRHDAVLNHVARMADGWQQLPPDERDLARRVALLMLREVVPD